MTPDCPLSQWVILGGHGVSSKMILVCRYAAHLALISAWTSGRFRSLASARLRSRCLTEVQTCAGSALGFDAQDVRDDCILVGTSWTSLCGPVA